MCNCRNGPFPHKASSSCIGEILSIKGESPRDRGSSGWEVNTWDCSKSSAACKAPSSGIFLFAEWGWITVVPLPLPPPTGIHDVVMEAFGVHRWVKYLLSWLTVQSRNSGRAVAGQAYWHCGVEWWVTRARVWLSVLPTVACLVLCLPCRARTMERSRRNSKMEKPSALSTHLQCSWSN